MRLSRKSPFRRRSVIALGAAALAVGCKGQTATYELKTANRDTLPVILRADSICLVQLMGGKLLLEGRTFDIDYTIRKVCPTGSTPLPDPGSSGKYDMDVSTVTFRDSLGNIMNRGEVKGDTIVITGRPHVLRFVK